MVWPEDTQKYEDISIGRFPDGGHYYLSSNMGRIFVPEKYNTYDEALTMARNYVEDDHIRELTPDYKVGRKEGD